MYIGVETNINTSVNHKAWEMEHHLQGHWRPRGDHSPGFWAPYYFSCSLQVASDLCAPHSRLCVCLISEWCMQCRERYMPGPLICSHVVQPFVSFLHVDWSLHFLFQAMCSSHGRLGLRLCTHFPVNGHLSCCLFFCHSNATRDVLFNVSLGRPGISLWCEPREWLGLQGCTSSLCQTPPSGSQCGWTSSHSHQQEQPLAPLLR